MGKNDTSKTGIKARKQRVTVPKDETAEQRTKRLADFRVKRVLKNLDSIGKLGSSAYTLTSAQCQTIIKTLQGRLDSIEARFEGSTKAEESFSL